MKTIINNNQKIFYLYGDMHTQRVCNIKDLPEIYNSFDDPDSVKISFFWNGKLKRVSKKLLNSMFEANQMPNRIL